MTSSTSVKVVPTGAALGADIVGLDLRKIDDATFAAILDAWHQHSVLRFRGQDLDDGCRRDMAGGLWVGCYRYPFGWQD